MTLSTRSRESTKAAGLEPILNTLNRLGKHKTTSAFCIISRRWECVHVHKILHHGRQGPGFSYNHDDVIKWKHFPRNWPFVRGIHRSPGEFPAQRPLTRSFDGIFDLRLHKRLSKQSWGRWFETSSRPLWRHFNDESRAQDLTTQMSCSAPCTRWINVEIPTKW